MDIDSFKKKYGLEQDQEQDKDTSLRGQSLERAKNLQPPRTGTPFDWEDWERYQQQQADDN